MACGGCWPALSLVFSVNVDKRTWSINQSLESGLAAASCGKPIGEGAFVLPVSCTVAWGRGHSGGFAHCPRDVASDGDYRSGGHRQPNSGVVFILVRPSDAGSVCSGVAFFTCPNWATHP